MFSELVDKMPRLTEDQVQKIQNESRCIHCHSFPLDRRDCRISQMSYYRCRQCSGLFLTTTPI